MNLPAAPSSQDLEKTPEVRADILEAMAILTAVFKTDVSVEKLALIYQRVLWQFKPDAIAGAVDKALIEHTWQTLPLPADMVRWAVIWRFRNDPQYIGDVGTEEWLRARGWI